MTILDSRWIVTRKPRKCWGCDRTLPAETRMRVLEDFDEPGREFSRTYWCEVCTHIINDPDFFAPDDQVGEGEVRGENPEAWEKVRIEVEGAKP